MRLLSDEISYTNVHALLKYKVAAGLLLYLRCSACASFAVLKLTAQSASFYMQQVLLTNTKLTGSIRVNS